MHEMRQIIRDWHKGQTKRPVRHLQLATVPRLWSRTAFQSRSLRRRCLGCVALRLMPNADHRQVHQMRQRLPHRHKGEKERVARRLQLATVPRMWSRTAFKGCSLQRREKACVDVQGLHQKKTGAHEQVSCPDDNGASRPTPDCISWSPHILRLPASPSSVQRAA